MPSQKRTAKITRNTKETKITLALNLDGTGRYKINTPLAFLNHMLESFAKHGLFDLNIRASGDTHVDDHHLVEDVGLVLGQAFARAIGNKKGIRRYGHFSLPMDDAIANVAVDFCGRPCLVYKSPLKKGKIKTFDLALLPEFFQAFANEAGLNLHIHVPYGENKHHVVEAIFKSLAKAMDMATSRDPRIQTVLTTKGKL